jgi:hypothetical protein
MAAAAVSVIAENRRLGSRRSSFGTSVGTSAAPPRRILERSYSLGQMNDSGRSRSRARIAR